jgi:hypothetical protein
MGEEVGGGTIMRPPEYGVLPDGCGYLRVYHAIPGKDDPGSVQTVEQAGTEFVVQEVPGVITDVRRNPGG